MYFLSAYKIVNLQFNIVIFDKFDYCSHIAGS